MMIAIYIPHAHAALSEHTQAPYTLPLCDRVDLYGVTLSQLSPSLFIKWDCINTLASVGMALTLSSRQEISSVWNKDHKYLTE